jgi:hypothetical protein
VSNSGETWAEQTTKKIHIPSDLADIEQVKNEKKSFTFR